MMTEFNVAGVLLAPIVIYCIAAGLIFVVVRSVLGRLGLLGLVWHPALFEVALFTSILSLLVLFV
jgi:hypothetical protein